MQDFSSVMTVCESNLFWKRAGGSAVLTALSPCSVRGGRLYVGQGAPYYASQTYIVLQERGQGMLRGKHAEGTVRYPRAVQGPSVLGSVQEPPCLPRLLGAAALLRPGSDQAERLTLCVLTGVRTSPGSGVREPRFLCSEEKSCVVLPAELHVLQDSVFLAAGATVKLQNLCWRL